VYKHAAPHCILQRSLNLSAIEAEDRNLNTLFGAVDSVN